ncbi:MAG: hypothetical protein ABIT76_10705 [Chthoniobacterales bacterium]
MATSLQAATGDELLVAALPASAMNKSVIKDDVILRAVYKSVGEHKKQAPEIVCAAMSRTRGLAIHKEIVRTAITALGDPKTAPRDLIVAIVHSAVTCSTCSTAENRRDGRNRNDVDDRRGEYGFNCDCAAAFTRVAIEALGTDPSQRLVTDIVTDVIRTLNGRCADRIVSAASEAAPQFASAIAEAGASAGGNDTSAPSDEVVFSPTGRPVPAPFVFPPATNGGIVPDTTPVN